MVNGNCEFDAFCEVLEREKKENIIGSLFATLEAYANIQMLPGTRFKELKRHKSDPIKDYEIKSDTKRFRVIKHEYIKHTHK